MGTQPKNQEEGLRSTFKKGALLQKNATYGLLLKKWGPCLLHWANFLKRSLRSNYFMKSKGALLLP
jgi:hypothetical protein